MIIHKELIDRGFIHEPGTRLLNFYTLKYCPLDFELKESALVIMLSPHTEPFFKINSLSNLDKFLGSIQLNKTERIFDN